MTSFKILQYIGDCLCDVCLELANHRRSMLVVSSVEITCKAFLLVGLCGDVFVTSIKILQYIGDCLCDVCLELENHRRIMLVVSSVEITCKVFLLVDSFQ